MSTNIQESQQLLARMSHAEKAQLLITMQQIGSAGQGIPDDQVLVESTTRNRCLLTFNWNDFIRLQNQNNQHSGIVVCTFDTGYAGLAQRIHQT